MGDTENHGNGVRIGMITPSTNTCLEPTTYWLMQGHPEVTTHFARIEVKAIKLDETSDAQFGLGPMTTAGEQLADAEVDVIAWNGTSGSWLGVEADDAITGALSKRFGTPVTTSTKATLEACRAMGVARLGIVTPYQAEINERIGKVYTARGIDIIHESHRDLTDNLDFGRVTPEQVADQIRTVAADVDAVAVLCTNVHGATVAESLEQELGVHVLDSVTVTLWECLRLAGYRRPLWGRGALLRDGFDRLRMQQICDELIEATGADRTTLRIDLPGCGLGVDLAAAEATGESAPPIRREGSLDQRKLNTVEWLEHNRANLVQPHFTAEPMPPAALIDIYGVRAQMLGPVERDGKMVGWLSVHSLAERPWTPEDQRALDAARQQVQDLIDTRSAFRAERPAGT